MADKKGTTQKKSICDCGCGSTKNSNMNANASGGAVYGLGFVGSLIYLMQNANGFAEVLYGILQAILWPAFLVYRLFELLRF